MRVEEVLKLHDNGWTKEEIQAFIKSEQEQPTSNTAQPAVNKEEAPVAQEPVKPVAHTESIAAAQMKEAEAKKGTDPQVVYSLTEQQISDLAHKIAVVTTGGVFETPKDFNQVLDEHLESLLKGE